MMKIDCLILGLYETNCYILRQSGQSEDCLIIDTGLDPGTLINFLKEQNLNPATVVLTHGHIDHIAGLTALRQIFPEIKVYIHQLDAGMLDEPMSNLSAMTGAAFTAGPTDFTVQDKDIIEQAGIKLQVLHTPGHTPGGISLYSAEQGVVFSGDALFADSVGRTDFTGGSMTQLVKSIEEKLLTLPEQTKVYPGHGPATTIAHEKAYNQYLQ
jgi:hydroxyacylglutathione hydrolase